MKIVIASFDLAKFGGIVEYTAAMLRAFRELGHDVDVVQMTPGSTTQKAYDRKVAEFSSGEHQRNIKFHSQLGGYERDEATGYWRNNYYGYYLPPSNRIGVYEADAVERWKRTVDDTDIILWNFMPTKSGEWERKGVEFNFWWKFFDLPSRIRQVFLVHDAYFNVRASNVSALRDKILFLGCAHLAAYQCCSEIGIPRTLLLNPRYIREGDRMPMVLKDKREVWGFSAHMFKPMKHQEELVAAVPYLPGWKIVVAGTGIEYNYMTSPRKTKPCYMCTTKRDPLLPKELDRKVSLWDRATEYGMEYRGQMSGRDVAVTLRNTKYAIDPSWSEHYARYCRTHINGFTIEAMINGAYPVLRDYRGLGKDTDAEIYDPLFENVRAVIIPWNATPGEFAAALRKADELLTPQKYLRDTLWNYGIVKELFNARKNAEEIIRLCRGGRELVREELECGQDSKNVRRITHEIMEDFFHIPLPVEWETD